MFNFHCHVHRLLKLIIISNLKNVMPAPPLCQIQGQKNNNIDKCGPSLKTHTPLVLAINVQTILQGVY